MGTTVGIAVTRVTSGVIVTVDSVGSGSGRALGMGLGVSVGSNGGGGGGVSVGVGIGDGVGEVVQVGGTVKLRGLSARADTEGDAKEGGVVSFALPVSEVVEFWGQGIMG